MDDIKREEAAELLKKLDDESVLVFHLLATAMLRDDRVLIEGIKDYGRMPRRSDTENESGCVVDLDLAHQVKTVCPDDEALAWGRALAQCIMRSDQRRADALQRLMRHRVAN